MTTRRWASAAVVALVALLCGCSGTGAGTATQTVTATPVPITVPTSEPSPSKPGKSPKRPPRAGQHSGSTGPTRRVESSGIALEVPEGWQQLTSSAPELDALSQRSGVPVDQLRAAVQGADLGWFNTAAAAGTYPDNLSLLSVPAGSEPTGTKLEFALMGVGAHEVLSSHVSTALGDVVSATYELELGSTTVHGVTMLVVHGDTATVITISAHDAATASDLARVATDSVQSAT